MSKATELRDKSIEELEAILSENKSELFSLQNQLVQTKKLEKPHLLKERKKTIARVLTILTEKNARS